MSLESEARVQFVLADYASVDVAGKLNVIGGGITFIGSQGAGQPSSPFTLAVTVAVPGAYASQTYVVAVELQDLTTGTVVQLPTQAGGMEPIRAQQAVTVPHPTVAPGMAVPPDAMQEHKLILQFSDGLPLSPGRSYEWQVRINEKSDKAWGQRFHVLGQAPGPVFGGPNGPSSIPGVSPPFPTSDPDH